MELKELTKENREEIISQLRNRFNLLESYVSQIDLLIHKLVVNKEKDLYDLEKTMKVIK